MMTEDKERRLVDMRKSLERESAISIDFEMDVTRAEEKLVAQEFLVGRIWNTIRYLEEEEKER